jgi:phosphosulfolactate synthase (CoM biosynthesis protein A)
LFEYKQRDKVIKRDNLRLRPKLTPHNQVHCMIHACGQVGVDCEEFSCMFDSIHIDEKWFYVEQDKEGFLMIASDEGGEDENTYRSTKSKNFIKNVTCLAAVARPWEQFSGKIGI